MRFPPEVDTLAAVMKIDDSELNLKWNVLRPAAVKNIACKLHLPFFYYLPSRICFKITIDFEHFPFLSKNKTETVSYLENIVRLNRQVQFFFSLFIF